MTRAALASALLLLACGDKPLAKVAPPEMVCPKHATADCDHRPENGCEVFLEDAHDNCNACGNVCGATEICSARRCIAAPVTLATGFQSHSCAILPDHTLACWGPNESGQLGDGTTVMRTRPAHVSLPDVVSAAVNLGRTCAIVRGGALYCWGASYDPGVAPALVPTLVPTIRASAVAIRERKICGRDLQGKDFCLSNALPVLVSNEAYLSPPAIGSGFYRVMGMEGFIPLPTVHGVIALTTADHHRCVVDARHHVRCWGFGIGENRDPSTLKSVPVEEWIDSAVDVAAGAESTIALDFSGHVAAWGDGRDGAFGDGDESEVKRGVRVVRGLDNVAQIVDGLHACAAKRDGEVVCWGRNAWGGLGIGESDVFPHPVVVTGVTNAVKVVAGKAYSCALLASGDVSCWGRGRTPLVPSKYWARHMLVATSARRARASTPTLIGELAGSSRLVAFDDNLCAFWRDSVLCSLGGLRVIDAPTGFGPAAPAYLDNAAGARSLASNWGDPPRYVAAKSDGHVDEWDFGRPPRVVPGLGDTAEVAYTGAVYDRHANGTIECSKSAAHAQSAPNSPPRPVERPLTVPGISDAVQMASRQSNGVFIVRRSGELDVEEGCGEPLRAVAGVGDVVQIAVSAEDACVRTRSGGVLCWGKNEFGQLGRDTLKSARDPIDPTPMPVVGLTDAVDISVGENHTCAVRRDGAILCWGSNRDDQVGQPDRPDSSTPLPVSLAAAP